MFYGLKIVVDRLPIVNKKYQNELKTKEVAKAREESEIIDVSQLLASEREVERPKNRNRNKNDISQFLD